MYWSAIHSKLVRHWQHWNMYISYLLSLRSSFSPLVATVCLLSEDAIIRCRAISLAGSTSPDRYSTTPTFKLSMSAAEGYCVGFKAAQNEKIILEQNSVGLLDLDLHVHVALKWTGQYWFSLNSCKMFMKSDHLCLPQRVQIKAARTVAQHLIITFCKLGQHLYYELAWTAKIWSFCW